MIHLRGNNVYPSALEAVIRRFAEVAEYRLEVDASQTLSELRVEVEPRDAASGVDLAERVARAIRDELLFRNVLLKEAVRVGLRELFGIGGVADLTIQSDDIGIIESRAGMCALVHRLGYAHEKRLSFR